MIREMEPVETPVALKSFALCDASILRFLARRVFEEWTL
jgi:hypothetical protein